MLFSISNFSYLARDPAVYGTDVLVRETRKKRYLQEHPEDRMIPRQEFRLNFALWSEELEGSLTEAVVLLQAVLMPQDGAPEITDEFVSSALPYEIDEVLNFFSEERTKAYLAYAQTKNVGKDIIQSPTETTST